MDSLGSAVINVARLPISWTSSTASDSRYLRFLWQLDKNVCATAGPFIVLGNFVDHCLVRCCSCLLLLLQLSTAPHWQCWQPEKSTTKNKCKAVGCIQHNIPQTSPAYLPSKMESFMLRLSTVFSVQPDCTEHAELVSDDEEPWWAGVRSLRPCEEPDNNNGKVWTTSSLCLCYGRNAKH